MKSSSRRLQGWQSGFQSRRLGGRLWNTEKYCWPPWLAEKKNSWILDPLEWLKQYFDLGDSLLIVSALKPFLFCFCLTFFRFATQKSGGPWPHYFYGSSTECSWMVWNSLCITFVVIVELFHNKIESFVMIWCLLSCLQLIYISLNSLQPSVGFLYPLKTSGKLKVIFVNSGNTPG